MPTADKVYTLKDVSSHDLVLAFAQHLKKEGKMQVPKWVDLAKTGPFKELAPYDQDWYYIRAAAIARRVYLRGGVGVGPSRRSSAAATTGAPARRSLALARARSHVTS